MNAHANDRDRAAIAIVSGIGDELVIGGERKSPGDGRAVICFEEVMRLLTAGRGAINSIMAEVVEDHILMHMIDEDRKPSRGELDAAEELLSVLRTYIK